MKFLIFRYEMQLRVTSSSTVNNATAIASRNPNTFCLGFWHDELLTDEAPPVARGIAPVGRGGVGRTSCRLAGVPVGVTC